MSNKILQTRWLIGIMALLLYMFASCKNDNFRSNLKNDASANPKFFGDSTLTIVSSNKPNGYSVKIFQTKELTIMKFSRGDSIAQYVALAWIPENLMESECTSKLTSGVKPDRIGTYICEINIPRTRKLIEGISFMDVNFDGEDDLVISHLGYNRIYYTCFDLINGSGGDYPGFLLPMSDEPYNNIVGGMDGETVFDYFHKTIQIFERSGCCASRNTWCELVLDEGYPQPEVKVVRIEEVEWNKEGCQITVYERIDKELKKISEKFEKY